MTLTPSTLCKNVEVRKSATYFYSPDGTNGWYHNDTYYSEKEFAELFPVNPMRVKVDGQYNNSDTTKDFLFK